MELGLQSQHGACHGRRRILLVSRCFFPGLLGSSRGSVDVVTSRGVLLGCPAQLLTFVWVVAFLFVSFFVVPFSHSLLPSE